MPLVADESGAVKRLISIFCKACQRDHGITPGAAVSIILAFQDGDILTVKNNTQCLLSVLDGKRNARHDNLRVDWTKVMPEHIMRNKS